MGYNLQLYCRTCDERAYVFRGHESQSISLFSKAHAGPQHVREAAIDNGFAERPWIDVSEADWKTNHRGRDLALPDDLLPNPSKDRE